MKKTPEITQSEWKVMRVLWRKSPQPTYDITTELSRTEDWHPNTIKTLLSRLHKKRAVAVKKYKNLFLYSPLITEDESIHAESESFLQRLFGGSVRPLLVHFAEKEKLTREDLAELQRILERKEKK